MTTLRSLLFNIAFWLVIAVLGLCALPFTLLYPPLAFPVSRLWASTTLLLLRLFCGITYEVHGREYIPTGPALVASKHQSAWDTVIFWMVLPRPIYVLKKELIYLPIFGWYLLFLKSIHIDRKSGGKAVKRMLRQAADRIRDKSQIVIFPEGTRIAPGAASIYHPGVAAMYQHLDVPLVPVALNSGYYWSKNAFVKRPGKIIIEFMPPIMPGLKSREFLAKLQETIDSKSAELALN
jgi:1-acyl-sn-glycerol-3-phosphate acyltransferase